MNYNEEEVQVFGEVKRYGKEMIEKLSNYMCIWCCSRHLGINHVGYYKLDCETAAQRLMSILDITEEKKDTFMSYHPMSENGAICRSCYGILTHYTDEKFIDKVCEGILDSHVEFEHFLCAIGLPVSSAIREYSFLLVCADICPEQYSYLALDDIPSVKDIWKWMCGSLIGDKLKKRFALGHMDVNIEFTCKQLDQECNNLQSNFPGQFNKHKGKKETFTRTNICNALCSVSRDRLRKFISIPPSPLTELSQCTSITCTHQPLYVAGRYNKYSRTLPQSPWVIDGKRKCDTSLSEILAKPLLEYTQAENDHFSSSGREDIDVLMLGSGRPFMLQFISPRRLLNQKILTQIQTQLNDSQKDVKVSQLQLVRREDADVLKSLETEKRKQYRAICRSDTDITQESIDHVNSLKTITIDQLTPVRVLHRRALSSRSKIIHWFDLQYEKLDNKKRLVLDIETQEGTYIKEFVHGDLGRTRPSLSDLLKTPIEITQLDVTNVDVDWPKTLPVDSTGDNGANQ